MQPPVTPPLDPPMHRHRVDNSDILQLQKFTPLSRAYHIQPVSSRLTRICVHEYNTQSLFIVALCHTLYFSCQSSSRRLGSWVHLFTTTPPRRPFQTPDVDACRCDSKTSIYFLQFKVGQRFFLLGDGFFFSIYPYFSPQKGGGGILTRTCIMRKYVT